MGLHIKNLNIPDYEEVIEVKDAASGLHAFIAIHDTTLGPALGGIRFLPYSSREEALTDVLRLAEGMTYKSSISGLAVGGGKSTVIWDPKKPKPKEMLHAFAKAINFLEGRYIGAEDMNCFLEDVDTMHEVSNYVLGLPGDEGTGDPARFTARGVFVSIQAVSQYLFGDTSLRGKKVLVQGAGGVGRKLIKHLFWAGADIFISDICESVVRDICHTYGATAVSSEQVYEFECDIFAPCARGGILNEETIKKLKCKAVAGAANNQLLTREDGKRLKDKGILYAPDYLINAGGVIDVASGMNPDDQHPQKVLFKTEATFHRLLEILEIADQENICPSEAADQKARSLILEAKEKQNALV